MSIQWSLAVRNAVLNQIETTVGDTAILKLRTGSQPADCGTSDSGTVLATLELPSDWMNPASSGSKTKSGTWKDVSADNSGTIGHFRLYASDGTTCHMQGTAGTSGDLVTDSATTIAGQIITVTLFTLTAPGA